MSASFQRRARGEEPVATAGSPDRVMASTIVLRERRVVLQSMYRTRSRDGFVAIDIGREDLPAQNANERVSRNVTIVPKRLRHGQRGLTRSAARCEPHDRAARSISARRLREQITRMGECH